MLSLILLIVGSLNVDTLAVGSVEPLFNGGAGGMSVLKRGASCVCVCMLVPCLPSSTRNSTALRQQRRVDVEARVVGSGTDQANIARFHIRQEQILL